MIIDLNHNIQPHTTTTSKTTLNIIVAIATRTHTTNISILNLDHFFSILLLMLAIEVVTAVELTIAPKNHVNGIHHFSPKNLLKKYQTNHIPDINITSNHILNGFITSRIYHNGIFL